jgi:hypothetical protein
VCDWCYTLSEPPVSRAGMRGVSTIIRDGPGASTLIDRPSRSVSRSGIELREKPSMAYPYTVRVKPAVRRQIEEELAWCGPNGGAFADRERRETGGVLYSSRIWPRVGPSSAV